MVQVDERLIFNRCITSVVLLIISLVCDSVAWGHWNYTLDYCSKSNCGCIFYAVSYDKYFSGGDVSTCQFIVISQGILLVIAIAASFYYGYRVFFKPKMEQHRAAALMNDTTFPRTRRSDTNVETPAPPLLPKPQSRTVAIITLVCSVLVFVYILSVNIIAFDGFISSCNEYRKQLVTLLPGNGNSAEVINSRLSCLGVFDFMDYLTPDRQDPNDPLQYSRRDRINTGIALVMAKSTLMMNTMNWLFISLFHLSLLRQNHGVCKRRR